MYVCVRRMPHDVTPRPTKHKTHVPTITFAEYGVSFWSIERGGE